MSEEQKRSYSVLVVNNELGQRGQRAEIDIVLENINRKTAERIISEIEDAKEKIKSIMAG